MTAQNAPALAIFAKYPEPGKTKSRLAKMTGDILAADIAKVLLTTTARRFRSSWQGPIYLYGSPDNRHFLFEELASRYKLNLVTQAPGDLGVKMRFALSDLIARHGAAAIIGADVPHCPATVLSKACDQLKAGNHVIGPAKDGGYYLIGCSEHVPEIFESVAWGTSGVFEKTREIARALAINLHELEPLSDIDEWEDLKAIMRIDDDLRARIEALPEYKKFQVVKPI